MRMNEARGIGPVACKYQHMILKYDKFTHTVIASCNCLASGVDHCRVSVEVHLRDEQCARLGGTVALRAQLRAANDNIDLIQAFLRYYRRILGVLLSEVFLVQK